MAKRKQIIRKPFSELTNAEKRLEAHNAIGRLQDNLRGNNRYGPYGDAIRGAIKRWERLLCDLPI